MFNLNIYNLMILFMEVQADNGLRQVCTIFETFS